MKYTNLQAIFNKAYKGLHKQGFKQSLFEENREYCMYRGKNGFKCAIGHCISNKDYHPTMEGRSIHSETIVESFLSDNFDKRLILLIGDLQDIHDYSSNPHLMKKRLHKFAKQHDLTIPQV